MRVSDFVGACWRRVWVKGPSLLDEPSFPPSLKRWGMVCCALPCCLWHCSSFYLRKTRLPAALATPEAATDLVPLRSSFHQGNHMGSQNLTKPVMTLTACSLRGRGGVETGPPWGKGPGYQGHLCEQRPLSRRRKAWVYRQPLREG